ncbi:MAG: hypothetical protein RBR97_20930 [Bacteroidales bacterium]|nr:hypothetical protein [Bacteroidales bacterium]
MKTNLRNILYFSLLGIFTSCASVDVTVSKFQPPKENDCNLDVFFNENEIKKEFEVIALIDSRTGTTAFHKKTVAEAIRIAKPKACEAGADAILIVQSDTEGISYASYGMGKAIIKCLKYTK